ncbi:MAG: ribosome biogenesis factor YjgA [Gammaproteobacteria bacterium]
MENEVKNDPLDEIELVSKSQLKRESHDIQKLGKRLTSMNPEQLSAIPLDEPVLEAIALAHKIQNKRSALKRHYQFLGKLLRARDTDSIVAALSEIDQSSQAQIKRHHRAEHWRDEIIANGSEAIESFIELQPNADRQKLRQLWRNQNSTNTDARKTQILRLIYQEVIKAL